MKLGLGLYDGMFMPDHTPHTACPAPWPAGMAFALGYIRAAMTILEKDLEKGLEKGKK